MNRGRRAAVSARQGGGGARRLRLRDLALPRRAEDRPVAPQRPHCAARLRDEEVRRGRRPQGQGRRVSQRHRPARENDRLPVEAGEGRGRRRGLPGQRSDERSRARGARQRAGEAGASRGGRRHARVRAPAQSEPHRRALPAGRSARGAGPLREVRPLLPDDPDPPADRPRGRSAQPVGLGGIAPEAVAPGGVADLPRAVARPDDDQDAGAGGPHGPHHRGS